MNLRLTRLALLMTVVVVLLLASFVLTNLAGQPGPFTVDLVPPGFVQKAYAEEASALVGILDEAGIAGYYQTDGPIVINNVVRNVFRTIEAETSTYIVGSVPVPDFPESYDVHTYIHADGWIMIYYLKADPVAKIFDWNVYTSDAPSIVTVFETVAPIVAGAAGKPYEPLSFYDFRYPNANQMTLIAEDNEAESNFTVQLPAYVYSEYSWSFKNYNAYSQCHWRLNNANLGSAYGPAPVSGLISAGQMPPGATHTVDIYGSNSYCEGGLVLVYRVP